MLEFSVADFVACSESPVLTSSNHFHFLSFSIPVSPMPFSEHILKITVASVWFTGSHL